MASVQPRLLSAPQDYASEQLREKSILLVINSLRGGGAERQLSQIAEHFFAKGCRVAVATWTNDAASDFYRLHPSVDRFHLGQESGLRHLGKSVRRLRRAISQARPHTVLSFSEASNVTAWLSCLLTNKRVVVAIRANPELELRALRWWRLLILLTYRLSAAVVVQTQAASLWCRTRCGREAKVIPNAIRELPTPSSMREKTILAVGSLVESKGHDVLLRAFSRLHERHPDWRVVIVGDGPRRDALRLLSEELGISSKVDFVGISNAVEHWMELAGIFVLSSRYEGFPNVLLEAMAMGAPVISTDCPNGPAEIITDGQDGILVPLDDVDQLSAAIEVLITSPVLRNQLSSAAQSVRLKYGEHSVMRLWEATLFPIGAAS